MANNVSLRITKRLRQIRNAWHSQFKLSFVSKVQWFRLGGCVAHYLTRRYVALLILVFISSCLWQMVCGQFIYRKVWRALCYLNVCVQCRFRSLGFLYIKAIFVAGRFESTGAGLFVYPIP
ncbi:hypothetical protein D051_4071 [Vibrio parahaemolyticus VPCR-2010]|nr:hypothetical protein D051_4071 [Vibrio parahaemolyticus VPCR-2010]